MVRNVKTGKLISHIKNIEILKSPEILSEKMKVIAEAYKQKAKYNENNAREICIWQNSILIFDDWVTFLTHNKNYKRKIISVLQTILKYRFLHTVFSTEVDTDIPFVFIDNLTAICQCKAKRNVNLYLNRIFPDINANDNMFFSLIAEGRNTIDTGSKFSRIQCPTW